MDKSSAFTSQSSVIRSAFSALDRLGETVEAILDQTRLTEDELVEFLDPGHPMPELSDRGRR